jgi:hypothetical protein
MTTSTTQRIAELNDRFRKSTGSTDPAKTLHVLTIMLASEY